MRTNNQNVSSKRPPELLCGTVHLVVLSLELLQGQLDSLAAVLSADELGTAARFRYNKDRNRFMLGRAALRYVLSTYTACAPDQLYFDYGEFGKPALRQKLSAEVIRFNASGSQGHVAIAVGRGHQLGVDIEQPRSFDDWPQIATRYYTARESEALFQLPAHRQVEAFFHCWTVKEAVLKLTGQGLQQGLDQIEVSVDPSEHLDVAWRQPNTEHTTLQSLWAFRVQNDALVTLASEGPIIDVIPSDVPALLRPVVIDWTLRSVASLVEA